MTDTDTYIALLTAERDEALRGQNAIAAQRDEQTRVGQLAYDRAEALSAAVREICDAAEILSRPGSVSHEWVNAQRMTNAVQAAAKLIGHTGVFPELGA